MRHSVLNNLETHAEEDYLINEFRWWELIRLDLYNGEYIEEEEKYIHLYRDDQRMVTNFRLNSVRKT